MRNRIIAVTLVLGMVAAAIGIAATNGAETRQFVERMDPWESPNGIINTSMLPATMGVGDSTGAVVGYTKTSEDDLYPQPVYGEDGSQIGHVGEYGYYALGESEPYIADAYTVIEEFDADGERIRHEIIRPIAPEPGHTGPVGHTHENLLPENGGPGSGDGSTGPVGGTH